MRRFAFLALSMLLTLGLTGALAQDTKKDEPKKDAPKVEAPKTDDTKKADPAKDATKEATKAEEPLPAIPPDVEKKLEAARRAVAEAIVAAQDAGLVKSSIDPPPILDILITGRANDEASLKSRGGVSPEVFGAWFTGYGKTQGITPQSDVRIIQPSAGLKAWYDQRDAMLRREIDAVRKAKGTPAPAATKPAEEPKKDEPKAEPKKEETKKDEPKAEPKKEEPKKEEPKAEPKKDEPKAEAPKEEPKKEAPKDEPKKDEPKKDEPKK